MQPDDNTARKEQPNTGPADDAPKDDAPVAVKNPKAAANQPGNDDTPPPKRKRDELEFLPAAQEILETPASPAGRAVMFVLCLFFLLAGIWSWFGHVDVVATARGRVIPTERVKVIQPAESGTIKAIHVAEGQHVRAGEVLVDLDPTLSIADLDRLVYDLNAARVQQARLEQLLTAVAGKKFDATFANTVEGVSDDVIARAADIFESALAEYKARYDSINSQLAQRRADRQAIEAEITKLETTLPLVEERLAARNQVAEKGYGSKLLALQVAEQAVEIREGLNTQRERLNSAKAAVSALEDSARQTESEFTKTTQEQLAESEQKAAALEQELIKAKKRLSLSRLTSPVDGTVQQLAVSTLGGVVSPGMQLMVIVPEGSALEIEAYLENKDIGFVEEGDEVEIKFDTFKFTKYGVLHGVVQSISQDAVMRQQQMANASAPPDEQGNQNYFYAAMLSLDERTIRVEDRDVPITPGMSITAEIKTGERRLLEFLISPLLRYRDEAMRER